MTTSTKIIEGTNEEKANALRELRQQLSEAKAREVQLARELDALPEKIKDAARRATRERAAAAREGKNAAVTVEGDREVEELERRRGSLPFERWGARVHRAELQRQVHLAEAAVNREALPALQEEHEEAKRRLEVAKDEEHRAYAAKSRVMLTAERAASAARTAEREIAELEALYPRD